MWQEFAYPSPTPPLYGLEGWGTYLDSRSFLTLGQHQHQQPSIWSQPAGFPLTSPANARGHGNHISASSSSSYLASPPYAQAPTAYHHSNFSSVHTQATSTACHLNTSSSSSIWLNRATYQPGCPPFNPGTSLSPLPRLPDVTRPNATPRTTQTPFAVAEPRFPPGLEPPNDKPSSSLSPSPTPDFRSNTPWIKVPKSPGPTTLTPTATYTHPYLTGLPTISEDDETETRTPLSGSPRGSVCGTFNSPSSFAHWDVEVFEEATEDEFIRRNVPCSNTADLERKNENSQESDLTTGVCKECQKHIHATEKALKAAERATEVAELARENAERDRDQALEGERAAKKRTKQVKAECQALRELIADYGREMELLAKELTSRALLSGADSAR